MRGQPCMFGHLILVPFMVSLFYILGTPFLFGSSAAAFSTHQRGHSSSAALWHRHYPSSIGISRSAPRRRRIDDGSHLHQSAIFRSGESDAATLDWSFLDAVYIITCPNADVGQERLSRTLSIVNDVGIADTVDVIVKRFSTDDEDRVRGCYTSHIETVREVKKRKQSLALVLEDNFDTSGSASLKQSCLNSWARFVEENAGQCDMIHLAYTPYVPNFSVKRTDNKDVIKLFCGENSALGTSAYIITGDGAEKMLRDHRETGYNGDAIPDVMARLFPDTRFAAFPSPFQRAGKTKSLVNPQLDEFRNIMFQPVVLKSFNWLLVLSSLPTNNVLQLIILTLVAVASLAGKVTFEAGVEVITTGSYHGNALVPLVSCLCSMVFLGVVFTGLALAPKPEEEASEAA